MMDASRIKIYFKQHWGATVRDFVELLDNHPSYGWQWRSMDDIPLPVGDLDQLKQILKERIVTFRHG